MGWVGRLPDNRDLWECNRCGVLKDVPVDGDIPLPPGYHVQIRRSYDNRKKRKIWSEGKEKLEITKPDDVGSAYYCSKDCMMDGIQYHNYG